MKLPAKISPDRIRDSIVEVKYISVLPFEILAGFIFKALDDSYRYTNIPLSNNGKQILPPAGDIEITMPLAGQKLFYTDKIKLELRPNSLIFNCLNGYSGWKEYRLEIQKTLFQIRAIEEIKKFNRIGIRYISEYPDMEIKKCTKFNFSFGIPEIESDTYVFRTEFDWKQSRVILGLQHQAKVFNTKSNSDTPEINNVSIVDIDVICENLDIDNIPDLMAKIDATHETEKEIFFNLLNTDYLNSLNPIYE